MIHPDTLNAMEAPIIHIHILCSTFTVFEYFNVWKYFPRGETTYYTHHIPALNTFVCPLTTRILLLSIGPGGSDRQYMLINIRHEIMLSKNTMKIIPQSWNLSQNHHQAFQFNSYRCMYQRKVDVDMLKAVKSVLADVSSVSPSSEQRQRANARNVSQHTLCSVHHIHINLTWIHCSYKYTDLDGCTTQVSISHWTTLTNVYILLFGLKILLNSELLLLT